MQDMTTGEIEQEDESGNGRDVAPGVALSHDSIMWRVYCALLADTIDAKITEGVWANDPYVNGYRRVYWVTIGVCYAYTRGVLSEGEASKALTVDRVMFRGIVQSPAIRRRVEDGSHG